MAHGAAIPDASMNLCIMYNVRSPPPPLSHPSPTPDWLARLGECLVVLVSPWGRARRRQCGPANLDCGMHRRAGSLRTGPAVSHTHTTTIQPVSPTACEASQERRPPIPRRSSLSSRQMGLPLAPQKLFLAVGFHTDAQTFPWPGIGRTTRRAPGQPARYCPPASRPDTERDFAATRYRLPAPRPRLSSAPIGAKRDGGFICPRALARRSSREPPLLPGPLSRGPARA